MALDEFLAWDSEKWGDVKWQLVHGEPVAMAPTRFTHASLQAEVARLLGQHLLATGRRCIVATEPGVVPKVQGRDNYRVSDVGVTCAPAFNDAMFPDPVLLIEIKSPNNRAATRANVWSYTTIPSVHEILLMQSTRIEADLLRRQADGNWPSEPETIAAEGRTRTPLNRLFRPAGVAVSDHLPRDPTSFPK